MAVHKFTSGGIPRVTGKEGVNKRAFSTGR